MKLYWIGVVCD